MTTVEVRLTLSDEVLSYLQRESQSRNVPLDDVVSDVLADYFDEPAHEDLLAGLKRSLGQVAAGDYRPAREFLDEIDHETGPDADNC
jgi:hypothetical protein